MLARAAQVLTARVAGVGVGGVGATGGSPIWTYGADILPDSSSLSSLTSANDIAPALVLSASIFVGGTRWAVASGSSPESMIGDWETMCDGVGREMREGYEGVLVGSVVRMSMENGGSVQDGEGRVKEGVSVVLIYVLIIRTALSSGHINIPCGTCAPARD